MLVWRVKCLVFSKKWFLLLVAMAGGWLSCGCQFRQVSLIKGFYAESNSCVPRNYFFPDLPNFRDLGGWSVGDGMSVRYGRIYRSSCMNEEWHWYRSEACRVNISESTRNYIVKQLGIKTDLDLRRETECRGMRGSPLGSDVRFINIPSSSYGALSSQSGKDAFARVFRVFLDELNYPILFHCAIGRDRAGSVAFILEALLGVGYDDLIRDWQLSGVWYSSPSFTYEKKLSHLVRVFDAYDGENINAKVESYVLSLGFSREDISKFRQLMLERKLEN